MKGSATDEKIKIFVAHEEDATGSRILKALRSFKDLEITVQPLATADYVVSESCAVETKASWDDLFASVNDGRLWKQLETLKETYERPLLLVVGWDIEYDDVRGKTFIYREGKGGKFHYKVDIHRPPNAVRGILATIEVGYGIPIHRESNAFRAANYIRFLGWREQIKEKKPVRVQLAKKKKMTLPELQRLVVESLGEGIGPALAEKLLLHFKTPEAVITASEAQLQEVEGIGAERAKRIREVASTPYTPIESAEQE